MQSVMVLKDYTTICAAAPSEILALASLLSMQKILDRNAAIYSKNLTVLNEFFRRRNSLFRWTPPNAGTVVFPEYLGKPSADVLCKNLLDACGVMLLPSSILGYQGNYVRMGFGRKDMPDVLERLDHFLA